MRFGIRLRRVSPDRQLRHLVAIMRPYVWRLAASSIFLTIGAVIQLAVPLGLKTIFDSITRGVDRNLVMLISVFMLAGFLLRAGLNYFGQYLLDVLGDSITCNLRAHLFGHLLLQSASFHNSKRSGDLISRFSSDVAAIRNIISDLLVATLLSVLQLTGASIITLFLNWQLASFVLAVGSLTTIVIRTFGPLFKKVSRRLQDALADSMAIAHEGFSGVEVITTFNRASYEVARFRKATQKFFLVAVQARKLASLFSSTLNLISALATVLVFWNGAILVAHGRLSAGSLVAFLFYSQNITQYVWSLGERYSQWAQALGASQHVFELLEENQILPESTNAADVSLGSADIRFQNVSFAYGNRPAVLKNVSLDVQRGETVAIVGASGEGKSTILKLIVRLYDVSGGSVRINGIDVRQYRVRALRRAVAVVSQDVYLFGATIFENIRYGRLEATESEVRAAAAAANAHEFIMRLPLGYSTEVGERGCQLSGGQRQRIAIARALLKNAPILLLDEAMSAVDPDSEALVRNALEALRRNRTTLICAHKGSIIESADRVFRLVNGELTECSLKRQQAVGVISA